MSTSNIFQNRINEIIEESDCRKNEFATKVGISTNTISHATMYGIVPSLNSLIKIADFLNTSIDYILGKTNDSTFYKCNSQSTFQQRLVQITEEQNTKFSKIAHSMPFPRNLFYDWIRRNSLPTVENLYFLADYFNVSPDYLLGRTDYKD